MRVLLTFLGRHTGRREDVWVSRGVVTVCECLFEGQCVSGGFKDDSIRILIGGEREWCAAIDSVGSSECAHGAGKRAVGIAT